MKRIGIVSDTHAYWDDKYAEYFAECDEIWHAGDIGSMEVAERLSEVAELRAVVGNCDGGDLRRIYPETLRFRVEDVEVLLTHIGGYPGHYDYRIRRQLMEHAPQLMVCGHSHILKVQYDKTLGMLHINPGAAGRQGWQQERTLVRVSVDGREFKDLEVVSLGGNKVYV